MVTLAEAKAKLLEARCDIAIAKAKLVGLAAKTPEDAAKAISLATDFLGKAAAALLVAAPNVAATEKLAAVQASVDELEKSVGAKDFEKNCAAISVAIVALDKALQVTAFGAFLLSLFVIALVLACLETIANPYATVLGPPETSTNRLEQTWRVRPGKNCGPSRTRERRLPAGGF